MNFKDLVTDLYRTYKTRIWMSAVNPASFSASAMQPPAAHGAGALVSTNPNQRPRDDDSDPFGALPPRGLAHFGPPDPMPPRQEPRPHPTHVNTYGTNPRGNVPSMQDYAAFFNGGGNNHNPAQRPQAPQGPSNPPMAPPRRDTTVPGQPNRIGNPYAGLDTRPTARPFGEGPSRYGEDGRWAPLISGMDDPESLAYQMEQIRLSAQADREGKAWWRGEAPMPGSKRQ